MKKTVLIISLAFLGFTKLFSLELVPTKDLLASYLEKDSEIKNLALELQKAELNQSSTKIDNGFNITLSTGDMVIKTGDKSSFTVKPAVKASIPQLNNLGLNVSGDIGVQDGKTSFDGASVNLSADIITSAKANRDIKLLQSERSLLEAERKLSAAAVNKEKEFYKNLSSLLSTIASLVSKQNSLIEDQTAFERIKLQGYASNSSTYIKSELKVKTTEREIDTAIHSLIYDYTIFYLNCGYEIEIPQDIDFTILIPDDLPEVQPLDINSYKAEQYSQIESALWNQSINKMSREASKKFTLTANGGYSYRNINGNSSNTVNAGVNAAYEGIGLNAGVSVPIGSEAVAGPESQSNSPTITLGLSYTPNTFSKNNINDQLTQISIEQEQIKIDSAYSSYESAVRQQELKLKDLQWTQKTNETNYQMYLEVENQIKDYYNRGLVSKMDYTSASINTLQAKIKIITNQIDMIIYNDDIKVMFVE